MTERGVVLEIEGPLAIITLDRPSRLNALTAAMIADLGVAADRLDTEPSVRMAVLTGAGERAFCAGGDIADWGALDPLSMGQSWVREGHRVFDRLARLKVPLVAVLNGHALGGGLELAGVADLRIAEAHATVALPETGIGMVPGWSGTQRLVRRFGAGVVRRMSLFGARFSAEEALRLGIVDEVVGRGVGLARARELAASTASRGPAAVTIAKQLINAAEGEEREAALEILAGAVVSWTEDLKEGLAAFREKRPPAFAGR
jgi:enoyl-CoA hydratase/carnithine racemase